MHNDTTLAVLDETTKTLGTELCKFVSTSCTSFDTRELPREAEARTRWATKGKAKSDAGMEPGTSTQRAKTLNLDTYKFHALGDVAAHIREFGTTDSYSTEVGELEHRTVKARYSRTDHKEFTRQVARIERRQARVRRIERSTKAIESFEDDMTVTEANGSEVHHLIGKTENLPTHIGQHVNEHFGDPAVQGFIPKLKKHLLPRVQALLAQEPSHADLSAPTNGQDDWQSILLRQERIYRHNIMRVHYTSYDVRRGADVIHVKTSHCNIMLLNPDFNGDPITDHPYLYARVIGIYHANVVYAGRGDSDYHPRRVEFLWVRWYTLVEEGCGSRRLDKLCFPSLADEHSFGFVDPND
ncbi:hypothetical protein DXG01_012165, partial [Tephrocybe rancida]